MLFFVVSLLHQTNKKALIIKTTTIMKKPKNQEPDLASIGCFGTIVALIVIVLLFASCVTVNVNFAPQQKPQPQNADTLRTNIESWY